jgi:multiple sugar transport system substrate-binding protein
MKSRKWVKSRSRAIGLLLVAALVTLTAACGSGGKSSSSSAPSSGAPESAAASAAASGGSKDKVELRAFWWGNADRAKLYDQIFDLYEKQNPNVKIIREWTSFGDYWPKLATEAAGGNLPDIFGLHVLLYGGEYANKNVLEPLQPYVDKGLIKLDGWDQSAIDAGKMNGQLLALPKGLTVNALIVDGTTVQSLGLPLPEGGMSMSRFKDYLKQLKAKLPKNVYPMTDVSFNDHGLETFVRSKGKSLMTADGSALGFTKEDLAEFWTVWDDFRKEGLVPPAQVTSEFNSQPDENSPVVKKQAVMDFQPSNKAKIYSRTTSDDLKIIRFPVADNAQYKDGVNLQAPSWAISNKSRYKDEAAKLIGWFVNDVEAQKIYNMENGIPGNKNVRDALLPNLSPFDVQAVHHYEEISPNIPPTNYRPEGAVQIMTIYKKINEQLAFNKMNVQQAVDAFFSEAEKTLKK